jgi:hypothetical protein
MPVTDRERRVLGLDKPTHKEKTISNPLPHLVHIMTSEESASASSEEEEEATDYSDEGVLIVSAHSESEHAFPVQMPTTPVQLTPPLKTTSSGTSGKSSSEEDVIEYVPTNTVFNVKSPTARKLGFATTPTIKPMDRPNKVIHAYFLMD